MKRDAKIFIAGAGGMVGSAIVRRLLAAGYTNLVGSYHSHKPDADRFVIDEGASRLAESLTLVPLDLSRQDAVERFFARERPADVFLAAARVGGIHANNTYPAQFIHDNLVIQNNVIDAAHRSGVDRLLFLGSSCIYPQEAPQPIRETHLLTGPLEPTNAPYAIAKIAGIQMCEAYNRQYDSRFIAVMPTNLYGPNDNFDLSRSHVLPALIRKFHLTKLAADGDRDGIDRDEAVFGPLPADIRNGLCTDPPPAVTVWGSGSPRREFLHVDDMADACVFVMNFDDDVLGKELLSYPRPCFLNVGSGRDCTIGELAGIVQETVGFGGATVFDTNRPDGTPQKLLDVSRMAALGWRPSISLVDGIRRTYRWYLARTAAGGRQH